MIKIRKKEKNNYLKKNITKFIIYLLIHVSFFNFYVYTYAENNCDKFKKATAEHIKCIAQKEKEKILEKLDEINKKKTLWDFLKKDKK